MKPYLDIKELAAYLSVKPSTLYAWVEQGLIPHLKLGRLIRFEWAEIQDWLKAQHRDVREGPARIPRRASLEDIDALIDRAKRGVYTGRRGKPDQDRATGKGENDGSV